MHSHMIDSENPLEVSFPSVDFDSNVASNLKTFPLDVLWTIGAIVAKSSLHIALKQASYIVTQILLLYKLLWLNDKYNEIIT